MLNRLWLPVYIALLIFIVIGCQTAVSSASSYYAATEPGSVNLGLKVTQPLNESVTRSNPVYVSGTVAPSFEVTINGVAVELIGNHFSYPLWLEPGPNSINISALAPSCLQTITHLTIVYIP